MKPGPALLADLTERARACGRAAEPKLAGLDETQAAHAALAALREAGLTAFTVPQKYGGADVGALCARKPLVSVRALCALRDELAWHSGMLDVMLVMQGLGSFPITFAGNEKLIADVLPAVARGESIAAFALTEPDAGSSLADIATHAVAKGQSWRLNGQKTFISNAGIADHYSVLARTSGASTL